MATEELTCKQIVELVTEYLDGKLPEPEQRALELHLDDCPGCVAYLDQMRDTIRLTGRLTEESLAPGVQDELVAVFRGWSGRRP